MNKKTVAIILETIPVISAALAIGLIVSSVESVILSRVIAIAMLLGFSGFLFFIIGRLMSKDKAVLILGILDILATVGVVGFYVIAIFCFGL